MPIIGSKEGYKALWTMSVKETHTTPSEPDAVGCDPNMGITSNQLFTNPFLIHFLVRNPYKSGKTLLVIHVFPSHIMYSRQRLHDGYVI